MAQNGNGGIFSKFQERLFFMRKKRSKARKKEENERFISDKVKEIQMVMRTDPGSIRIKKLPRGISEEKKNLDISDNFKVDRKSIAQDKSMISSSEKVFEEFFEAQKIEKVKLGDKSGLEKEFNQKNQIFSGKGIVITEKEDFSPKKSVTDVADLSLKDKEQVSRGLGESKVKEPLNGKVSSSSRKTSGIKEAALDDAKIRLEGLEKKILTNIMDSFEDKLDELEVLKSELYFLNEDQERTFSLKEVEDIKKKIRGIIDKINEMIEQYNLYNKNYYIDHVVGIDDEVIVDDLIEYRTLVDSYSQERALVKEYKLLDEFKSLYQNLLEVKKETTNLVLENESKIEEFEIRDEKYNQIKLEAVHVEEVNLKCSEELERQNAYLQQLIPKLSDVDREEYVTTHLRGFGNLLGQSLRYVGLMLASPLGGLIPGIAVEALATRRLVSNAYRQLHFDDVHHVRYLTFDYDSELRSKLVNIDYTEVLVDDTLRDIRKLKEDFLLQYDSRIVGYDATLKNINKIEDKVLRNQNRLEIIRKNLKESKKLNEEKMIRVRALNEGEH